jgi:hypothetical protein
MSNIIAIANMIGNQRGGGGRSFSPASLNPVLWFDATKQVYSDAGTTPITDGGTVAQWNDQSGVSNNNLTASGTGKPTYSANAGKPYLTFDGVANFMKATAMTLNQPDHWFIVMNLITWPTNKGVADGNTVNSHLLYTYPSTPSVTVYAGGFGAAFNPSLGSFGMADIKWNGASSKGRFNLAGEILGDSGTSNAGGLTIGGGGNNALNCNVAFSEIIIYPSIQSDTNATLIYNYLKAKYGL